MASIKVKFRASAADREGTVYYQIIHERMVRQLLTDYSVYASEWDARRATVIPSRDSRRAAYLASVRENIRCDVARLQRIDRYLSRTTHGHTSEDIIDEYNRYAAEYTLSAFMQGIIARLKHNGKIRTSETYRSALDSFRKFLASRAPKSGHTGGSDIMLDCLDSATMEAYEAWLRERGVTSNTVSFYNRILRAVYNRAVDIGVIDNRSPFRHVYTGIDKTVKRALPIAVIRKIKVLDLSSTPRLDYARDMFMMSFYLRGMSFIDMAFLRKTDLRNGYITYRRRKTGRRLIIKWTAEMQRTLAKYPPNESDYLLPVIVRNGVSERAAYRNAGYNINRSLRAIAERVGAAIPLTLYVARHSWASAAHSRGIPLPVISEGMGHDSETTTRIYLAALDCSAIDRANAAILKSL